MHPSYPTLQSGPSTWGYRLAHGLAYVVSPLVWPPLLYGLVPAHFGAPPAEIAAIVLIATLFFVLLPLAYVLSLIRRRRVASLEIRERQARTVPFLVGVASSIVAVVLLYRTGTTAIGLVTALGVCHVANLMLVVAINLRWKISVHTTTLAGFVSVLLFVALTWPDPSGAGAAPLLRPAPTLLLLPLVPVMMWARVRTGAHTKMQVAAGALLGALLPFAELALMHAAGLLD